MATTTAKIHQFCVVGASRTMRLFTTSDAGLIGIAGLVRTAPETGEAFTMLTTEPGPDVAPYHSRQVAMLAPDGWLIWLDHSTPAASLIGPLPAGSLKVVAANR